MSEIGDPTEDGFIVWNPAILDGTRASVARASTSMQRGVARRRRRDPGRHRPREPLGHRGNDPNRRCRRQTRAVGGAPGRAPLAEGRKIVDNGMKFLLDECLPHDFASDLAARGFPDNLHPIHVGLLIAPDHVIVRKALDDDRVVVTVNAVDNRRLLAREPSHL